MYIKTRGIVLQAIKYSETTVVAKIYTEKFGLQSYIVKGVRTAESKLKAAMLQPLTLLEMEVLHREYRQLQYIKEFRRSFVYQSIPFDTLKSTTSLFLLEVILKSIREHESNYELFEFIYETLCAFDKMKKMNPNFHLLFLLHLSRYLGFAPHGNFSAKDSFFKMGEGIFISEQCILNVMNKKESSLLNELLQINLFEISSLKLSKAERKQMMKNLLKYYQIHLENFNLKSPEILGKIFD